jgi:hypothetical protein
MRDLTYVMGQALEARAQQLDGTVSGEGALSGLTSRVRRRRARRHTMRVIAVLPVVAGVAVGGWLLLGNQKDAPPVVTPTPVETPTPTPTATPEEPEIVLGDPIDEPGLPRYYAMPEGLLDQVGAGWVTTVHRPDQYVGDGDNGSLFEATANKVFLVSPDGTNYLVTDLPLDQDVDPVSWTAGDTRVRVATRTLEAGLSVLWNRYYGRTADAAWLDLRTGEVTVDPAGFAAGELPVEDALEWAYAPDGVRAVTGVSFDTTFMLFDEQGVGTDLAYGVEGKVCSVIGWLDASSLLALCVDDSYDVDSSPRGFNPTLFQVAITGGAATPTELGTVGEGDPLPYDFEGVWVRDGAVAFPSVDGGPGGCWTGVDMWVEGAFQSVQRPGVRDEVSENVFDVEAFGGTVYVTSTSGCAGEGAPTVLTAHDLRAGTSTVLAPAPDGSWSDGLSGWVVAE